MLVSPKALFQGFYKGKNVDLDVSFFMFVLSAKLNVWHPVPDPSATAFPWNFHYSASSKLSFMRFRAGGVL